MKTPPLSIVICTRRRPELLEGAVGALASQEGREACFEVLVVDNDDRPDTGVERVVEQYRSALDIRYVRERTIGLSHARNAGGREARADYIGYLDDDVRVPSTYVATVLTGLTEYDPDVLGGPYHPLYADPKPAWFRDEYAAGCRLGDARFLSRGEFVSGGNVVLRRGVLEAAGWFDPNYGMRGDRRWYAEETALQLRAWDRNPALKVYFDPAAWVHHLVPACKMRVGYGLRTSFRMGRCQADLFPTGAGGGADKKGSVSTLARVSLHLCCDGTFGVLFRKRERYPCWQNYYCEHVSKWFRRLGHAVALVRDGRSE